MLLRPIVSRFFRCQLRTGRGQKCDPKIALQLRTGGSRDHEHVLTSGWNVGTQRSRPNHQGPRGNSRDRRFWQPQ